MIDTVPNISKLLDAHLLSERDKSADREIVGGRTWRASKLGSCLRQQYLEFHLKQPKLGEFDALSLRRFEIGHAWGRQFAHWFKAMGFEVEEEVALEDERLDVGAHGDYVVTGPDWKLGVELKSVNSRSFWHRSRSADTTAQPENMMQAALYKHLTGNAYPWVVLTVSKDDLTMNQDVVTNDHIVEALSRLALLNSAKSSGVAPPCTCKDDWHWRYCGYFGDIKARDAWHALTPAKRKATPIPAAECCVIATPDWL